MARRSLISRHCHSLAPRTCRATPTRRKGSTPRKRQTFRSRALFTLHILVDSSRCCALARRDSCRPARVSIPKPPTHPTCSEIQQKWRIVKGAVLFRRRYRRRHGAARPRGLPGPVGLFVAARTDESTFGLCAFQRPTSYDTLRGDFREMHPPRPPGSTVPHDYSELDADQPPEYASEREEDAHHHGVVHGAHITGRNTSPSSPVIMPLSPGYNPQTGFEAPYDSDPEYQAARRARSLDLGPDTGSDDELPRYDPGGASPPPAYVPRAHEDQRSNRSGVYSDQPLSVGPHSHASSFQGQPTHWDPGRPRASTFNGEHAGAPAEAGGGGRRRSSSSAREPFSVLSRVSA